ncbi:putative OsmC-like protein [Scopulibacillus darangshiensis]|uniref:Putative OsmC-like protein n=1 Tax=Scopulibacillus darangshiensis TaxID=442528 RepID=A0A4R2NSW0_9BACL|nr:OsmC family protein [Scopulibacillus darangshiensis]TCP24528.1 putative OsmC-like protein [Scopulibacillus darangshiensis]
MNFKMTENGYQTTTNYGTLDISSDDLYGFRPFQLMVSSLAVCSGTVMKKIFIKKRLNVEDIHIEAEVTRNPEKADRIEKVHLLFKIKGENLEGKMDKIMELTAKNCSMVQSVIGSIDVTESYELV